MENSSERVDPDKTGCINDECEPFDPETEGRTPNNPSDRPEHVKSVSEREQEAEVGEYGSMSRQHERQNRREYER